MVTISKHNGLQSKEITSFVVYFYSVGTYNYVEQKTALLDNVLAINLGYLSDRLNWNDKYDSKDFKPVKQFFVLFILTLATRWY
jgi:hypothetical protein